MSKCAEQLIAAIEAMEAPFSNHAVASVIRRFEQDLESKGVEICFEVEAERLAAAFSDSFRRSETLWDTYYQPAIWHLDEESGEVQAYPSLEQLTDTHFSYWLKRSQETGLRSLSIRYADLVWDLQKNAIGEAPAVATAHVLPRNSVRPGWVDFV